MTQTRLLDLGRTAAVRTQAIYHAVAERSGAGDAPTLCILHPDRPYVSIGYHQQADRELDLGFCRGSSIPVVRRRVGGGAVLLDANQLFFHLVLPRERLAELALSPRFDARYARLVAPAIRAYAKLGVTAELRAPNDIQVPGAGRGTAARKIGGTGMADIGDSLVFVGSMMIAFDHALMARVLAFADESVRDPVRRSIEDRVTSLERELGRRPSMESVRAAILDGFRETLGLDLEPGALSDDEEAVAADLEAEFASEGWLHHVVWNRERPRKLVVSGAVRYVEGTTSDGTPVTIRMTEGVVDYVHVGDGAPADGAIAALTRKLAETAAA